MNIKNILYGSLIAGFMHAGSCKAMENVQSLKQPKSLVALCRENFFKNDHYDCLSMLPHIPGHFLPDMQLYIMGNTIKKRDRSEMILFHKIQSIAVMLVNDSLEQGDREILLYFDQLYKERYKHCIEERPQFSRESYGSVFLDKELMNAALKYYQSVQPLNFLLERGFALPQEIVHNPISVISYVWRDYYAIENHEFSAAIKIIELLLQKGFIASKDHLVGLDDPSNSKYRDDARADYKVRKMEYYNAVSQLLKKYGK